MVGLPEQTHGHTDGRGTDRQTVQVHEFLLIVSPIWISSKLEVGREESVHSPTDSVSFPWKTPISILNIVLLLPLSTRMSKFVILKPQATPVTDTEPSLSGSSENLICAEKVTDAEMSPLSWILGKDVLLTLSALASPPARTPTHKCTQAHADSRRWLDKNVYCWLLGFACNRIERFKPCFGGNDGLCLCCVIFDDSAASRALVSYT